ncbi:MAG: sigma-54 dependent transcriptional regulator [Desulfobacteraceae bacterium]|jgi:DNA-binding NtrC family response regulator
MQRALIVSTSSADRTELFSVFKSTARLEIIDDLDRAIHALGKVRYDMLFADLGLLMQQTGNNPCHEIMKDIQRRCPTIKVIVMARTEEMHQAVQWVKAGATDILNYPLSIEQIRLVTKTITESVLKQSELDYLRDQFWKADALEVVRTKSSAMKDVFKKIQSVATTKTTVLMSGETGTGKTVLAKLIHQHSNRHGAQFISVHCGAIPDTLIESELFGHEKGAFTGAIKKKMGKFELANGGTIFLDEIGTLTPAAQIKLLQVLQDGSFTRIGGEETSETNTRVIAATNENLKALSDEGHFRKDLYYRLNVFPIEIPPLSMRTEDLPDLIERFLQRMNREFQKQITGVHPEVIRALSQYEWPGNVRELENLVERAYILENSSTLTPESFPLELFEERETALLPLDMHSTLADARKIALEDFERQYLKALLSRNKGKINTSASEAGISTRQLHKLMRKYDIQKETFKTPGEN